MLLKTNDSFCSLTSNIRRESVHSCPWITHTWKKKMRGERRFWKYLGRVGIGETKSMVAFFIFMLEGGKVRVR